MGEFFIQLLTLSRPRIGLESLLEHLIFPNPPQGKVTTHKYSHHKISNPPITNPPNPGVPSYYMAFWQKTRIITQKFVDKVNH